MDHNKLQTIVHLKPGREKSVKNRHPWVFSGGIDRVEGRPEPGELVAVQSSRGESLGTGFFNAASQIRVRMLSFEKGSIDQPFFEGRIKAALDLRQALRPPETNALRLIHAEADGLPGLVVDQYDKVLVTQFNSAGMTRIKAEIVSILDDMLSPSTIYEKTEGKSLKAEGLTPVAETLLGEPPERLLITENGHRFRVDVVEGQKTGFFLDQRENRKLTGELAAGKKLLNCFAYTGGFSVYAATAGAKTVSVDISKRATEMAKENFVLNEIEAEGHQFEACNAFDYLREMPGDSFDMMVLDPPAFVQHRKQVDKGARGYKDINRLAISKVKNDGLVLSCSCSSFVSDTLFRQIIFAAASEAGRQVQILASPGQPFDHPLSIYHPEGAYLKTLLLRVLD